MPGRPTIWMIVENTIEPAYVVTSFKGHLSEVASSFGGPLNQYIYILGRKKKIRYIDYTTNILLLGLE